MQSLLLLTNTTCQYLLERSHLSNVSIITDLGIIIDSNLSFKSHIALLLLLSISHFDNRQSCVLRGQCNRLHRTRSGVTFCKHVVRESLKSMGFGYREKRCALVLSTVCSFHASPEHARRIDVFVLNCAILCFLDRRNCICSSRVTR